MAGKNAFFLTGATCKIRIGSKLVALATNISCTVNVNHATPRLLGQYEVADIQPVSYDISGQLTIIRYTRGLADAMDRVTDNGAPNLSNEGNSVGSYNAANGFFGSGLVGLQDVDIAGSFDPSKFFTSEKFSIEIIQVIKPEEDQDDEDLIPVVRIDGCRFTSLSLGLNKKGIAQQTYQFAAQYYSDDSFLAKPSGRPGLDKGLF